MVQIKKTRIHFSPASIAILVILCIYVISLILPLFWTFITSVKTRLEYSASPFGIPRSWQFKNFIVAVENFSSNIYKNGVFRAVSFAEMALNSFLFAVGSAFFGTLSTCIMAYAAAKFPFKFSKVIYSIVIITMIMPIVGSLPSEIQLAKTLMLYDSMIGMWIMKFGFLGMHFLIFHAVFKGVPKDFAEAAYVDGAGNLAVLVKIMVPIIRNTFLTIVLIKFIDYWNDYYTTMTFMPNIKTLAFGLYEYSTALKPATSSVPMQLAGCVLLIVPVLTIFCVFHNKIMGNISMGGIKE